MLQGLLTSNGEYSIALGPGFFRFYAHCGILNAFEELSVFHPSHVSGSSAGALVGSAIATGMKPSQLAQKLFALKRDDLWDAGRSFYGILRGDKMRQSLESAMPEGVSKFEDLKLPFAATAWDLFGFKTRILASGNVADAVRASCSVPLMFAPALIDGRPCIDIANMVDGAGIVALPGVPESKLVVNIVCGEALLSASVLPDRFKDCRLLTLVMGGIPDVSPFTMQETGPIAFQVAKLATLRAFSRGHIQQPSQKHWIVYLDGTGVISDASLSRELIISKIVGQFNSDDQNQVSIKQDHNHESEISETLTAITSKQDLAMAAHRSMSDLSQKVQSIPQFGFLQQSLSRGSIQSKTSDSTLESNSIQNTAETSGRTIQNGGNRKKSSFTNGKYSNGQGNIRGTSLAAMPERISDSAINQVQSNALLDSGSYVNIDTDCGDSFLVGGLSMDTAGDIIPIDTFIASGSDANLDEIDEIRENMNGYGHRPQGRKAFRDIGGKNPFSSPADSVPRSDNNISISMVDVHSHNALTKTGEPVAISSLGGKSVVKKRKADSAPAVSAPGNTRISTRSSGVKTRRTSKRVSDGFI